MLATEGQKLKAVAMISDSQTEELQIPEEIRQSVIGGKFKDAISANEKIDKKYVHKTKDENVLISNPVVLDPEKKTYRTKIIADLNHPFFFDHPLRHLPGILILEAVRQFGTALSHLFYNASFESQFILHEISSKFTAGAPVENETFIDGIVTDIVMKKGELRKMKGTAYIHQNKQVIGVVSSSWSMVPNKVLTHIDKKFH